MNMRRTEAWPPWVEHPVMDRTRLALEELGLTSLELEALFRGCATMALAEDVRALLRRRAEDYKALHSELSAHLRRLGGRSPALNRKPARVWSVLRTALPSHADRLLLEQCEEAEDSLLEACAEALSEPLEPPVHGVVERQRLEIRQQHELLRTLRDRLRGFS